MRRLVVVGRWDAVEEDVAPSLTRQTQDFQDSMRRDGVRKVRGRGILRHDCPVSPAADAGSDCFVYRLAGSQVVPIRGTVEIEARYRVWLSYEDGRWQVVNYDYNQVPAG